MSQTLSMGGNAPLPTENITVKCLHIGPDADLSALLLTAARKVRTDEDFIFYGQPKSTDGSVQYYHKKKTGDACEHSITVNLAAIPATIERIAITLTIDHETPKTFASVKEMVLTVCNASGQKLVEMAPKGDKENAFIICEIYKHNGTWKIRNFGQGFANGLAGIATAFGVDVSDSAPARTTPAPAVMKVKLEKPAPTGKVSLAKGKSIKIEKTAAIVATGEWKGKNLDYDLYCHVAYKDGSQEVVNFDRLGSKNGSVRHHGDLKSGGSGTVEKVTVNMTEDIAAIGFSFYSARENGQGSFSDARARVSIDNGAGSTVVIEVQQMSVDPRCYTLYFGTCINRDGKTVEIVAHEDYSARDSENQARLNKDGTHQMDAGPENRCKAD